jgi:pimeloyl-ACP methyl ester carboxylesterase
MPFATVRGTELHYFDDGPRAVAADNDVILMLHGFARNGAFWCGWVPQLAQSSRVIRLDIRGCGRNPDPRPGFEFRVEDAVADVIAFIEQLGTAPVHCVGESVGGIVGTFAASQRPELFRSLSLISTPTSLRNSNTAVKTVGASSPQASFRETGLADWWLRTRAALHDNFGDERDLVLANELARTPAHVAVSMWEAIRRSNVDLIPVLARVTVPALVMSPASTPAMSMDDQLALVAGLPDVRHKSYEGATHGMYYLRAEELAADVLDFIAALRPAAR